MCLKSAFIFFIIIFFVAFFTDTKAAVASDLKDATLDELLQAAGN